MKAEELYDKTINRLGELIDYINVFGRQIDIEEMNTLVKLLEVLSKKIVSNDEI